MEYGGQKRYFKPLPVLSAMRGSMGAKLTQKGNTPAPKGSCPAVPSSLSNHLNHVACSRYHFFFPIKRMEALLYEFWQHRLFPPWLRQMLNQKLSTYPTIMN